MLRRSSRVVLTLVAAALLAGCETLGYYAQAVSGQLGLLSRARPVEQWLGESGTPAPLREKLETALAIRDFASRELGLPDNASYRRYADLGRPFAVWNVVAAPEFSTKALQSCFPVAGCVSYRGFFAREDAERHAAGLKAAGSDVHVYGVPAYSTLGWFDDPLLSTFIRYPDAELARLVFHELAHQLVYARDDTTFNESFAVAVEEAGVRRWLAATGRGAQLPGFVAAQRRKAEFIALIEAARARLELLYVLRIAPEAMRERKHAEFDALQQEYAALKRSWGGFAGYDRFIETPNNALLASIVAYTEQLPAFEHLLEREGGDLARFYRRVRELAALDKDERQWRLAELK
jgi:predicted aminopeptidase